MTDWKPSFTQAAIRIRKRETLFSGFFRLEKITYQQKLFTGDWSAPIQREIFERGHSVALLPYNPANNTVVLLEQCRIATYQEGQSPWLFEIIAGSCDRPGESDAELLRREAVEEAGLHCQAFKKMLDYWVSPGGTSEQIRLYLGKITVENASGIYGAPHEHEDIRVFQCPLEEALRALDAGHINNSPAVIALQWLALHRDSIQEEWL